MKKAIATAATVTCALLVPLSGLKGQLPTLEDEDGSANRAALIALAHLSEREELPRAWMLSDFEIAPGHGVFEGTRGFRIQGVGSGSPVSIVTCDRDRCRPVEHPEAPVAVRLIEASAGTLTCNLLVPEVSTGAAPVRPAGGSGGLHGG